MCDASLAFASQLDETGDALDKLELKRDRAGPLGELIARLRDAGVDMQCTVAVPQRHGERHLEAGFVALPSAAALFGHAELPHHAPAIAIARDVIEQLLELQAHRGTVHARIAVALVP